MSLILQGSTSGSVTLQEPAVAGTTVLTLPATSGNVVVDSATQTLTNKTIQGGTITSGTAVASTIGTSIDFTSIPSWVKRITVLFDSVSTNGSSNLLIQIGDSGGIETSGYLSGAINQAAYSSSTAGFISTHNNSAGGINGGVITINLLNSSTNSWASAGNLNDASVGAQVMCSAGTKSLSATLDRVRITTVNGTDTFDAGSINILYE